MKAVNGAAWDVLRDDIRPDLESVARSGAAEGLNQVDADVGAALQQVNREALAWARQRAGELVTEISETTRDRVRDIVLAGLEAGESNEQIADELEESDWFGEARASRIARTETAFADTNGNLIGWSASGLVAGKEWKTDVDPCEEICAPLDGEVLPLDEEFPEGDPPAHPNCECVLLPVLAEEEGEETE